MITHMVYFIAGFIGSFVGGMLAYWIWHVRLTAAVRHIETRRRNLHVTIDLFRREALDTLNQMHQFRLDMHEGEVKRNQDH